MRRAVLAAAVLALAVAAPAGAAPQLVTIETPSVNVDPATTVFNGDPPKALKANVLLPDGYSAARAYPVLFLLHGVGDTYADWAKPEKGDIAKTAAGLNAIVVMPEGGKGFYTNWFNGGKRGAPGWERFYLDELIPEVRKRFRIAPGRRNHAIAGLSMGGFGAAYLGGQRPDFFGTVAVFSGFVQHQRPEVGAGIQAVGGVRYEDIFGPMDGFYASGHNPTKLAANLARTPVFDAVGNGTPQPGVAGSPSAILGGGAVEADIRAQNDEFVPALRAAGVDVDYRPQAGVHDWPYWRAYLKAAIAWGLFRPVVEHPTSWTYATTATTGRMWSLRYRFAAPPEGVATFTRTGGRISASGAPGARVRLFDPRTHCGFTAAIPFARALPAHRCRVRP
jgi:S-formylglutathione hydrolase FrmB